MPNAFHGGACGGHLLRMVTFYCGPFEILERIGLVAYRLALPPSIGFHDVSHLSLLKDMRGILIM